MKVQTFPSAPNLRPLNEPTPPPAAPPPEDGGRQGRVDAFYQAAGSCAAVMVQIRGGMTGGSLGFGGGTLIGAALGHTTGAAAVGGFVGAALAGYAGYRGATWASDLAGRLGRDLDKNDPVRGEALGRNALYTGLNVLNGGWTGAGLGLLISGTCGVVGYARHKESPPSP